MKSINIFFALLITLAFASCSSEGDILDEMNNTNSSVIGEEKSNISVSIEETTDQSDDKKINNFIVAVFNGETRVAYVKGNTQIGGLKANTTVDVYVVANAGNALDEAFAKSDFLTRTTTLSQNTNELVKFGEAKGITLVSGTNILPVITLAQVAARVDLSIQTINCKSFTITSVTLKNAKSKSSIFGDKNEYLDYTTTEDKKTVNSANNTMTKVATLYTFANDNTAKQTTLVITGKIVYDNGTTDNREYNIAVNEGTIVNGLLYDIKATINPSMDVTVNYQVLGWTSTETIEVPDFN